MAIATAIDGTVLVFTARDGRGIIDTDTDLESLTERVQARADREDTGREATPHYTISLWHSGQEDPRVLHIYGNTQRGHAQPAEFVNQAEFDQAVEDAVEGPTLDRETVEIADVLVKVLNDMNGVDGLAYQRPGSAYQCTVDALKATLAQAIGGRTNPDHEEAERVYEGILDSGESATYILQYRGFKIGNI